ncbi:MAG: RNA-binding protein [Dorea sp.]|nr:RNA-binding protein [Dorea sp.]
MERYETGMLVRSKVGHDAGNVYIIIKKDKDFIYLADGRIRTLDKLKKKKRKHVQLINKVYDISTFDDVAIKRILKLYKKEA